MYPLFNFQQIMKYLSNVLVFIFTVSILSGSEAVNITECISIEKEKIIDYPGDTDLYRHVVFYEVNARREKLYESNGLSNGNASFDLRIAFTVNDITVLIIEEFLSGSITGNSSTYLVVVKRDILVDRIKFPHYLLVKKLLLSDGSVSKSKDSPMGHISKATINDKLELVIPVDLEHGKYRYIKLLE